MGSYFSLSFFAVYFPATVAAYGLLPKRLRWGVLLLSSYGFLLLLSKGLTAFVVVSTLSIYVLARWIGAIFRARDAQIAEVKRGKRAIKAKYKRKARWVLWLGILINFGILFALRYLGFFGSVISAFAGLFNASVTIEPLRIGVPLGISFYTLMAISYMVDVYRETTEPDRHLGRVALFLVFFPQIMEGPICRYSQTAHKLMEGKPLRRANMYSGSVRMLVGFAKKMIAADRLNTLVAMIFNDYATLDGGMVVAGAILYTFQLYCDFSGTMDVALGMAEVFGITLPENFNQPFFSKTTSEFWQRWHITLGQWFKDYVFYPVSFSKLCKSLSGKARKRFGRQYGPLLVSSIALFCVWFGNGLWHGAGSQYLLFGMYYFVLIVVGGFVDVPAQALAVKHGIDRDKGPYRVFRIARTICFIFVGEMLFRATSAQDGIAMLGKAFTEFSFNGILSGKLFGDLFAPADLVISLMVIAIVLVFDAFKEHGFTPLKTLCAQGTFVRWAVWVFLFMAVLTFGAWGLGYSAVDPMYANF